MIAKTKSKEWHFDVILVWKNSRFARNQEESIVYKSLLKKNNVDVISNGKHWLCGLYKCEVCGSNLVYYKDTNKKNGIGSFKCYQYAKVRHPETFAISEINAVLKIIKETLDTEQIEF